MRRKNDVLVYAEGGGDSDELKSQMRQAFSEFFDKTHLKTCKPRVIACGSRSNAFNDFRMAIDQGRNALLLVDSETPVSAAHQQGSHFLPWAHLKCRDNWDKPDKASDADCHLMVQVMESWFLVDWETNVADQRIHGTTKQQVEKLFVSHGLRHESCFRPAAGLSATTAGNREALAAGQSIEPRSASRRWPNHRTF